MPKTKLMIPEYGKSVERVRKGSIGSSNHVIMGLEVNIKILQQYYLSISQIVLFFGINYC